MIIGWQTTELDGQPTYMGLWAAWDASFITPVVFVQPNAFVPKAVHSAYFPVAVHQPMQPAKAAHDAGMVPKGVKG